MKSHENSAEEILSENVMTNTSVIKVTVIQIEKALINDHFTCFTINREICYFLKK